MHSILKQAFMKLIFPTHLSKFMFIFKRIQGQEEQLVEFNQKSLSEWLQYQK
jgi:hypothetical protein